MSVKIGEYVLNEDKVFKNTYETAAWYQNVGVKKGVYPVYGEIEKSDLTPKMSPGKIDDNSVSCVLEGDVVGSDFSSLYGGVPVSSKVDEDVGKRTQHFLRPYAHSIALATINEKETDYRLNDEFHVRKSYFVWNGEIKYTAGIYRKEDDVTWDIQKKLESKYYVLAARKTREGKQACIVYANGSMMVCTFEENGLTIRKEFTINKNGDEFSGARKIYLEL